MSYLPIRPETTSLQHYHNSTSKAVKVNFFDALLQRWWSGFGKIYRWCVSRFKVGTPRYGRQDKNRDSIEVIRHFTLTLVTNLLYFVKIG